MLTPEKRINLNTLITNNKLDEALADLEPLLSTSQFSDELIIIRSDYLELEKRKRLGLATAEQLSASRNQLSYRLLTLLKSVAAQEKEPIREEKFSESIKASMWELDSKVESLTREQFQVIKQLRYLKKVRISGCAGSGKTLVAAEKSIRLANAGISTLFLCHNPYLARHVKKLVKGTAVKVYPFGDWINDINGRQAGRGGDYWNNYFEPTGAELETAFDRIVTNRITYDAIVIDEAQDFKNDWWTIIEAALIDSSNSILYIFHDDNQAILPFRSIYPIDEPVIDLSRNCRNGGRIYDFMRNHFHHQAGCTGKA